MKRAVLNGSQAQTELAALERRVIAVVEWAERDYAVTRSSVERIEHNLLPDATQVRDFVLRRDRIGELDVVADLDAQRDLNEVVRRYRDTLVRHRRAMLRHNTVVGQCILP